MFYFTRIVALSLCFLSSAFAQLPASFSWGKFVADSPDQLRQGPCFTFAGVGATEIMYRLLGGTPGFAHEEFSKLQVFCCANPGTPVGNLTTVMDYLKNTGVIPAAFYPYPTTVPNYTPTTPIVCGDQADYNPYGTSPALIYRQNVNGAALQVQAGRRMKITYTDVTSTVRSSADAIKSLLINKGPIAISLNRAPAPHSGAAHAYVLIGWATVNGQTQWLMNDSWPCQSGKKPFIFDLVAAQAVSAYVISSVSEEQYAGGTWTPKPIPVRAFELDAPDQIAKIQDPVGGCYRRGTYTVGGLNLLPGTTVVDWFLRNDYAWPSDATISSSGVMSGNGGNVTVVATILRPNGLLENISRNVGAVGMPVRVDTVSSACYNGRREIVLRANAPGVAGGTTSVTINIPPSTDGRYYTIPMGSDSVYINYNGTGAINYTVTVNSTAPGGCSINYTTNRYVVIYPCGY